MIGSMGSIRAEIDIDAHPEEVSDARSATSVESMSA